MGEQLRERVDLLAKGGVARLRLLLHALEPPLDVVAVGDEQLELERLEIGSRIRARREAVGDGEHGVDLPQTAQEGRPGTRHVDDPQRRRRDLARADELRELRQPRVGNRRHADVLLAEPTAAGPREGGEERRLPRAGKPDDADLERHYAPSSEAASPEPATCFCSDASARC